MLNFQPLQTMLENERLLDSFFCDHCLREGGLYFFPESYQAGVCLLSTIPHADMITCPPFCAGKVNKQLLHVGLRLILLLLHNI